MKLQTQIRSIFLITTLLTNSLAAMTTWTCKKNFGNATYDLCPYLLTSESQVPYFTVWDNDTVAYVRNFSYVFNVAATVVVEPTLQSCNNLTIRSFYNLPIGYCANITTSDPNCINSIVPINTTTGAYQVSHGHVRPGCYRLHDGISAPIWTFYDSTDPSLGVVLTYTNGDYCSTSSANRRMRLQFICNPQENNYPDRGESVSEDGCMYTIRIPTSLGCPLECPIVNNMLCSGHGICDYDYSLRKSKCFCYSGLYGDDCSLNIDPDAKTQIKSNDNGYTAGLVVVIILLTLATGILIYLAHRLHRLLKNPSGEYKRIQTKVSVPEDSHNEKEQKETIAPL